jgi:diguanylate cyclase (GGDEF)-like protein
MYVWYPLRQRETRIGRVGEVDLELADETVSRLHARIVYENFERPELEPHCILLDEGSRNGTFLNGKRIRVPYRLENGDRIFIGKTCLVFYIRTEEEINSDQRIRSMATRDALTGLLNRGFMAMQFQREYDRARRYGRPLSMMMVDLDDFKKINDAHGHQAGDLVLEQVAQHIISRIRVHDIAGRYGGEEFAVLLPETGIQSAIVMAERLRRAIAHADFIVGGRNVSVNVSIGVAELDMSVEENVDGLVRRADLALLHAKRQGKNQVSADQTENV